MNHAARALATFVFFIIVLAASTALADTLTFSGATDISTAATDTSGATVTFTITAIDASSTPFTVTCTPPSGNLFSIGTTTVSCEAVDSIGATSSASFAVGVFEIASSTATSTPHITIEGDVDVPASCDVVDTDGTSHHYEAASTSTYIGICALQAAKARSLISDFQATNFSFGLFVTSIHGVAADPSSQYWALYQNGGFPSVGLTDLPVVAGDTILLQLEDFSGNHIGDSLTLHIDILIATSTATSTPIATSTDSTDSTTSTSSGQASSPQAATSTPPVTPPTSDGGGGGGGGSTHSQLNVGSALAFLAAKQRADGSFDPSGSLLGDWVAIAFASADPGAAKTKLKEYFISTAPTFTSITDYERHAMALEALGIDPYTGTSRDYIAPIVAAFDGTQIGSATLVNDDIFALLPLMHAGYSTSDTIIQKTTAFIISQQKSNGSWGDADMTAAAIQVLETVSALPGVAPALSSAENYLHTQQDTSGGFLGASGVNSFSTSWALQAIAALDRSISSWAPSSYTPHDYLAGLQQSDGGVDTTATSEAMRIWATAYAIPAAQNKTWDSLLSSFSKPKADTETANTVVGTTTSIAATTTVATLTATTTLPLATSTPLVLGVATSTLPITAPPPKPVAPAKPKGVVTTNEKRAAPTIAAISTTDATSAPATKPKAQTAAAASAQSTPNVFVRIWDFFKHLFGL